MKHDESGFTLPELLVAVALLAIVSLLSYRGLDGLLRSVYATEREAAHWRQLARASDRIVEELRLALPNPSHPESDPVWRGEPGTAADRINLLRRAQTPGAPVQRIGLRLEAARLELLYFPNTALGAPEVDVLLDDVKGFEVRYLDLDMEWRDRWPSVTRAPLPRAVRVRIQLNEGGTLERLVSFL